MKVRNMKSPRWRVEQSVPNQFIIEDACIKIPEQGAAAEILVDRWGTVFQSYQSVIAFRTGSQVYLDETYWDYSTTTSRYRNIFLGETTKETKAKIKSGEYKLVDLN